MIIPQSPVIPAIHESAHRQEDSLAVNFLGKHIKDLWGPSNIAKFNAISYEGRGLLWHGTSY